MSVYRCIADAKWDPHLEPLSDSQVLSAIGAPCVDVLLRRARLMTFMRVATKGSSHLMQLLHAGCSARGSWLSAITLDLHWLAICAVDLMIDPAASLSAWCLRIRADGGIVRRALIWAVATFGCAAPPSRAKSRTISASLSSWVCGTCGKAFPTRQALGVHNSRQHGELSDVRWYLRGTRCEVCALECHTRYHIIEHVAFKSPVCLSNYVLRDRRLSAPEVEALDEAERQRVESCRKQSANPRRQPLAAYRSSMPAEPVLREDGTWIPGDRGHPLGPNRRLLLLND